MSDDLLDILTRVYSITGRRFLAEALGTIEISPENLLVQWTSRDQALRYREADSNERLLLARIADAGGKVRGENLRRELMLHGHGDVGETLRAMVKKGFIFVIPNVGELDFDLEMASDGTTLLQRDLVIPPLVVAMMDELEIQAELEGKDLDVHNVVDSSTMLLELNLLHTSMSLFHTPLRLNKSGAPNKRNVLRVGRGLVLPGEKQELGDNFDALNPQHIDYFGFVLALSLELGLIQVSGENAVGKLDAMQAFFSSPVERRNRALADAFRSLKTWSELDSVSLERPDDEVHLSLTERTGTTFSGARGYVLSVLKRAHTTKWFYVKGVEHLCARLDPDFMSHTLRASRTDQQAFVHAFLTRGLVWLGLVDMAAAPDGEVVRITPRGAEMLGITSESTPEVRHGMGLVVQPNHEIMVFLDVLPLGSIFSIYRIGNRRTLADRVATFTLSSESVQRGYAGGMDAAKVKALLTSDTPIPLPDSVSFHLDDWERLHRRITLYAQGFLIRHPDPETLDLSVGQVVHDDGGSSVRLGPYTAFVTQMGEHSLRRLMEQGRGFIIDYCGPIPPNLSFAGPLHVRVKHTDSDVLTLFELQQISVPVEQPEPGFREFLLNPKKIAAHWPTHTMKQAIAFLDARSIGGLPPEQKLRLLASVQGAPDAMVHEDVTIIRFEDEDVADAFAEMPETSPSIIDRLGPLAFLIDEDHKEPVLRVLASLGVSV